MYFVTSWHCLERKTQKRTTYIFSTGDSNIMSHSCLWFLIHICYPWCFKVASCYLCELFTAHHSCWFCEVIVIFHGKRSFLTTRTWSWKKIQTIRKKKKQIRQITQSQLIIMYESHAWFNIRTKAYPLSWMYIIKKMLKHKIGVTKIKFSSEFEWRVEPLY